MFLIDFLYNIKKKYQINILKKNLEKEKIEKYRKAGINIGENCRIYSNLSTRRDCFLLNIGNNVTIAKDCNFILHDNAIIKSTNKEYTDLLGEIRIGDNCFIGMGTTILPGVTLAHNTIVGAGSVVTNSILKEGYVIAGNPAKVICSVEDYKNKNINNAFNLDGYSKEDLIELCKNNNDKLIKRKSLIIK